jgi:hypothetical protein
VLKTVIILLYISVADPGCFIPDPDIFSYGSYFFLLLWFQEKDLGLGPKDPGPVKFIPDPWGKKAPDPGSATLTVLVPIVN